jgi:signal transduction histidine kinase
VFDFSLEIVCAFLMAMSLIFIVIELRAKFDKSFLIFGITNLLLSLFCGIDIWLQPGTSSLYWTRIQHVLAAFFPAFILWYLMLVLHKVNELLIRFMFFLGFCFSLMFFTNKMFCTSQNTFESTLVYNLTFAPYMLTAIVLIIVFLVRNFSRCEENERKVLSYHIWGIIALSTGGILDMINLFVGHRIVPEIATFTMPGALLFGLIVTYVFTDRLTTIIRDRESTFAKLQEAYKELELVRPLARLGQTVAMVNHEIKNKTFNLAIALNSFNRISLPVPAKKIVEECAEAANVLSKFSFDILNQSRISEIQKERVDLLACVNALIDSSFKTMGNVFQCKTCDPGITVMGDPIKLRIVFENLFDNCLQAGATTIQIRISKNSHVIVAAVEDNGAGCEENTLNSLFSAFFTTKVNQYGTGLGLSIARTIVENHGGVISAYSKNLLGNGSAGMIFTIVLPVPGPKEWETGNAPAVIILKKDLVDHASALKRIFDNVKVKHQVVNPEEMTKMNPGTVKRILYHEKNEEFKDIPNAVPIAPLCPAEFVAREPGKEAVLLTEESILKLQLTP